MTNIDTQTCVRIALSQYQTLESLRSAEERVPEAALRFASRYCAFVNLVFIFIIDPLRLVLSWLNLPLLRSESCEMFLLASLALVKWGPSLSGEPRNCLEPLLEGVGELMITVRRKCRSFKLGAVRVLAPKFGELKEARERCFFC